MPGGLSITRKSSSPQWKWNKREDLQSFEDAAWYDVLFDYSHKIQIGKKKKINSPEYGGYTNQETFSWNVGFNLGQYGDKKNPLEYKNPETGKKESYGEYKTNTKGDPKFAPNKVGTIAEIYAERSGREVDASRIHYEYEIMKIREAIVPQYVPHVYLGDFDNFWQ